MAPLRIGFDALTVTAHPGGVGRVARGFLTALAHLPGDHELVAVRPRNALLPDALPRTTWIAAPVPGPDTPRSLFYQHVTMPRALRRAAIDIHVGPAFVLPLRPVGVPEVVVVHDAAWRRFPESKSRRFRAYMDAVVPRSMRRAAAVVANSEFTQGECRDLAPDLDLSHVHVVQLGVERRSEPPGGAERVAATTASPYLLVVSNFDPRKNLVRLVDAWRRARAEGLPHALVLVGDPARARALRDAVGARDDEPLVTPGYVDDPTLGALYARAAAVVVPSLYEGFGLPVLEAYAAGTRVACAAAGSLPEVAGDAAELFDPCDVAAIAAALVAVTRERSDDDVRRRAARNRAEEFTWERAGRQLLALLEHVAHHA